MKSGALWRSGKLMAELGLEGEPLAEWFWRGGRMSAPGDFDGGRHDGDGEVTECTGAPASETEGRTSAQGAPETEGRTSAHGAPETEGRTSAQGASETEGRTSAEGAPETEGRTSAEGAFETEEQTFAEGPSETEGRTSARGAPETEGRTSADGASETEGRTSAEGQWQPEAPFDLRLVANDVGIGRVTYRFTVRAEVAEAYRAAERAYLKHRTRPESFIVFITRCMWEAHAHALESAVAYSDVYDRDRWTCASPVCERCDCTPHHVVFRSHGGGEERGNIVTLCVWCHLVGVHEGRIRVTGDAPRGLEWVYGSTPVIQVDGRTKRELREKDRRAA